MQRRQPDFATLHSQRSLPAPASSASRRLTPLLPPPFRPALQSIQAMVNICLAVLDTVEKRHDLAYILCRWRNGLNNFTMVLATCTVFVDAIWNGFGWDNIRHAMGGRKGPAGTPSGDPEADAAAAAAADAEDDYLP